MNTEDRNTIVNYFNDRGYVLDFSTPDFTIFIDNLLGFNPFFKYGNISKGKVLKELYLNENDTDVLRLTSALLERTKRLKEDTEEKIEFSFYESTETLEKALLDYERKIRKCEKIINSYSNINHNIEIDLTSSIYKNLQDLQDSVNNHFSEGKFLEGLDRLHTLFHSYLIQKAIDIGVPYQKQSQKRLSIDTIYNNIFNYLNGNSLIQSDVTREIMKNSKSTFTAFNNARNKQSKSHPTFQWINDDEARYINSVVIATINLLDTIVRKDI